MGKSMMIEEAALQFHLMMEGDEELSRAEIVAAVALRY